MSVGDLVKIKARSNAKFDGFGIYLGAGNRGFRTDGILEFLWKGRIATFAEQCWSFEVLK